MKIHTHRNQLLRATRSFIALAAAMVLVFQLPAQTASPPVDNRFLLIFDTASAMKSRLPAIEIALDTLLATSMNNELHAGDSIGVWTFDRELRTGKFPLQSWDPAKASAYAADLKKFLHAQSYGGKTSLDALQPNLDGVVQNSERLTVMIFCDGQGETKWTPYDAAINDIFKTRQAERKKSRQPFILVLRSQRGQYVGSTIGFPPELLGFPVFPPLPVPETNSAPTNAPPAIIPLPPAPPAPSLVIIGTKVGTNLASALAQPAQSAPANVPTVATVVSNLPSAEIKTTPPAVPIPPTNPPPVETKIAPVIVPLPPPNFPTTNLPSTPPTNAIVETSAAPTNAVAPPVEKPDADYKNLLLIGGGLLIAAIALVIFLLLRPRRADRTSLITRSMNQDSRPPREK